MTTRDKSRLTAEQFQALWPKLRRHSANSLEVARLVLVEGISQVEAGELQQVSKQNVSRIIKDVQRAAAGVPKGWVWVEDYAPAELAEEFKAKIAEARAKQEKSPD